MQGKYQTRYMSVCMILIFAGWLWPKPGSSSVIFDQASMNLLSNRLLKKEILIRPQLNKLNFGFGRYKGVEFYYEKTVSKLFFQDKELKAKVVEVSIEETDITLELFHPVMGAGSVKFSFSDKLLEQISLQQIQQILLDALGDENHQYVVLDPDSKLYHLWSCSHFSDPHLRARVKRADAEAQGYRPSAICFKKVLYLPDLAVEKAIEAEWSMRLSNYVPIKRESEKQAHLSVLGEKVLKGWPFKLLGYHYAFYLAQSNAINAFAIPAGKVIVTTALFDSLDNDDELEALLAYAIAHIEQRHSLKNYYDCIEDEKYTDAVKKLASVASVLAGPAGGGISGALDLALPAESCNPRSLVGHQSDFVQQADSMVALYFEIHQKERQAVVSLIKKLQFSELTEKLHPDRQLQRPVVISNDTRIRRLKNLKFKFYGQDHHFILKRGGRPPVQLDLKYHQIFENENKIHIYVNDRSILALGQKNSDKTVMWLSITDKIGTHRYALQQDLLTRDVWGAFLTFNATTREKNIFLQDIEKISLALSPASGPYKKPNDQPTKGYTFVPGTIDW